MDEFGFSLAVSALAVVLVLLLLPGAGITAQSVIFLLAVSQAGFFAMQAVRKSGVPSPRSEHLFIAIVFVCFLASAFVIGASVKTILSFASVPVVLCAPAIGATAKAYFS